MENEGLTASDIGTHSARKGSATYVQMVDPRLRPFVLEMDGHCLVYRTLTFGLKSLVKWLWADMYLACRLMQVRSQCFHLTFKKLILMSVDASVCALLEYRRI